MMQNFETLKDAKRSLSPSEFKRIHQLALQAAADFKKSEVDLITALQFVSNSKVYRRLGFNSLYQYAIQSLGLSESQANDYTTVARKSLDFPKLKEAIESRELTISKVRRLCSVINEKNQLTWLELGKNISKKDLEKEIAKVNPRAVNPEQTRFLTDTVLELKLPISDKAHKTLEQVRDLLQQKHQRPLSLEEVISEISEFYIQKNDPIEKANRAAKRNSKKAEVVGQEIIGLGQKPLRHVRQKSRPARRSLRSTIVHAINLRDRRQCTSINKNGERCAEKKWLQFHHAKPKSHGGEDSLENLRTLCFHHHRMQHE